MAELRYTLLSDGSSDQALIPILTWLLKQYDITVAIQSEWADLRRLPKRFKQATLSAKIQLSLELYPCELLFVHRDAEKEPLETRITEIQQAFEQAKIQQIPVVCVVPVRMQEAWLLFDEQAIRRSAGNPNGRHPLQIPPLSDLENLADPKSILYDLLREASGLQGRRRKKFAVNIAARQVTQFIEDFEPLRVLPAFRSLETELKQLIDTQNWASW